MAEFPMPGHDRQPKEQRMLCDTLGTASEAGDFAGCLEKASPRALLLISTAVRQHVVWAAAEVEVREGRWVVQAVPKHFLDCLLCNPCAVNNVNSRVYIAGKCQEVFLLASSNNRSCL